MGFNIDAALTWCVWSVCQTEWRRSLFVGFLPPPLFSPPFSFSSPPSHPCLSFFRYSPPRCCCCRCLVVNHRVDASQLNLTEPLNHGTCHNSSLSPSAPHPPERGLTAAVWSLICFHLIRCESGWIRSVRARRTRQPCDPQISQETRNYIFSLFSVSLLSLFFIVFNSLLNKNIHIHSITITRNIFPSPLRKRRPKLISK